MKHLFFICAFICAVLSGAAQAIPQGTIKSLAAGAVMPAYTAVYVSSIDNRAYPAQRGATANNAVAITTVNAAAIGDSIQIIFQGKILDYSGSDAQKNLYLGTTDGLVTEFVPNFGVVQELGRQVGKDFIVDIKTAYTSGKTTTYKTADESRVSSTTLTADNTLTASLAVGTYRIEAYLDLNIATALGDYKYSTTFDGTASAQSLRRVHTVCGTTTTVTQYTSGAIPSTAVTGTTFGLGGVEIRGTIIVTAPGTFRILWAQNTSDPGAITAREGSYLEITRIK